jgi:hypothetical protein
MIVLPGGGYAAHAPHEAEPVASWLARLRAGELFRYPLNVRHPAPLDALRAEIRRRRAGGHSASGSSVLRGRPPGRLAALRARAAADQTCSSRSWATPITLDGNRDLPPARLICSARTPARSCAGRLAGRAGHAAVTAFFVWHTAEDPYVPPEHTYRFAAALAAAVFPRRARVRPRPARPRPGPRALARPRSGPRWRKPGSGNRRHHRDDPAPPPAGRAAVHTDVSTGRRPSLRQVYALPPGRRSRSCGNNCGGITNERKPAKADPKLCWNCGNRGVPGVGSRMTCPSAR